jgi:hypothetical protein
VHEQGIIEATRAALEDREFADDWAEGESLTLEQVSAEPLRGCVSPGREACRAIDGLDTVRYEQSLSARNPRN